MERDRDTLNSIGTLPNYTNLLLNDMILNNLVWKPGRKSMHIRGLVVHLLLKLVNAPSSQEQCLGLLKLDILQSLLEKKILPNLLSALEEDVIGTRSATLSVLDTLFASSLLLEGM